MTVIFIRKCGKYTEGTVADLPSHTARVYVKQQYAKWYQMDNKSMASKQKRKNIRRRTTVKDTGAKEKAEASEE